MTEVENRLAVAMGSMADIPTPYMPFMPIEIFANVAGKNGLEYRSFTITRLQTVWGLIPPGVKTNILSAEQSFRSEKGIREIVAKGTKNPLVFYAALTMPEKNASLLDLDKLNISGPLVLYPETNSHAPNYQFHNKQTKIFQISPHEVPHWNFSDETIIGRQLQEKGWNGFCIDLFHFRLIPGWKDLLPKVLPFTKEVQISLGRSDIPQSMLDTVGELKAFYSGDRNSEAVQLVESIKNLGWKGLWVLEFRALELAKLMGKKILTPRDLKIGIGRISAFTGNLLKT